ncbi:MAG: XRE family transcriptional regulator [Oscillibacter sp.]|nr:XRE family transcriptional regulator [Oscillibacter sp.]
MTLGSRIRALREGKRLSQKELAQNLHMANSTLCQYENDDRVPSDDVKTRIADYFGVTVDYLLGRHTEAASHKGVMIPVLGDVAAGIPIEAIQDILDYEEISRELASRGEYFGLRLRGDSMAPRMCEGDVVIVRKQSDADSGDVAVVLVNGDSATVKNIRKEAGGIWLIPNNPAAFQPRFFSHEECSKIPVQIIGIVVELRAKIKA